MIYKKMNGKKQIYQIINPTKNLFEKTLDESLEKLKIKNIKKDDNNKNYSMNNNNKGDNFDSKQIIYI